MKKALTLVLVFCLVLSVVVTAKDTEDIKEILVTVKERIGDTDSYQNFESSTDDYGAERVYHFNWWNDGDDYRSLSVSVTESGVITNFYRYDSGNETVNKVKPSIHQVSRSEAWENAKAAVKKLNPDIADHLEVVLGDMPERLYNYGYSFDIRHVENGVPVYGDGGDIYLYANGKDVESFYLSYEKNVDYVDPARAITKDEAKKAFKEHIGMELSYKTKYEDRTKSAYLSYVPAGLYTTYIDAVTGKAVTPYVDEYEAYATEEAAMNDMAMGSAKSMNARFSEAESAEFDKLSGLLDEKEAEDAVRAISVLGIGKSYTLTDCQLTRNYYNADLFYYNLYFSEEEKDGVYSGASATVNAVTGEVIGFNRYLPYSDKKTYADKAEKTAEKVLAALCPGMTGEKKEYRRDEETSKNGTFRYVRYMNDIPYPDNSITVRIDTATNTLSSYYISRDELSFPKPENILSADEAADRMFDKTDYTLTYYPVKSDPDKKTPDTAYLVYDLECPYEIDAFTGEVVDFWEEDVPSIPEYTDIDGHWAEDAIKTLAKFGVGFEEEAFRPDDVITQKEFIALLASTVLNNESIILEKGMDVSDYYRRAATAGILTEDEKDDDAPVTRLSAAVYLIRAIGLSEIADMEEIFVCPFPDVTEKKGYVAILSGMKVFSGDGNGAFLPEAGLSRGAAAVMLCNYLSR